MDTKELIIIKAKEIFSKNSESFSMRQLADACNIRISVLYYYFKNKEDLLKIAFDTTNIELGQQRRQLPILKDLRMQLRQRVEFQFEHGQDVIFVLKYFMANRKLFGKNPSGYIPEKGHLHIKEVLEEGVRQRVFHITNIEEDAKVITHTINGFILEYYPDIPVGKKRKEIVDMITTFILRALATTSIKK